MQSRLSLMGLFSKICSMQSKTIALRRVVDHFSRSSSRLYLKTQANAYSLINNYYNIVI